MTNDTITSVKYYWRSFEFRLGPPTRNIVTLSGPDFDTEEEARQDAEKNVKRMTQRWQYSLGGTSKYTIVAAERI